MINLEDIIEYSRVEVENNVKEVKIYPDNLPDVSPVVSFEQFSEVCEALDLPVIDKEMLDTTYYCRNMLVYLINMSSEIPMDLSDIIEKNRRIEEYFALDEEIDKLEILMANLKFEYENLNSAMFGMNKENQCADKINEFPDYPDDSDISDKNLILQKIYLAKNNILKKILVKLIENKSINIKDFEEMGIDKIDALKIIYRLRLKEIVKYEQQNDIVSLNI